MMDQIDQFNPTETCRAETLLYQAVSGLHASVNMHVSNRYVDLKTNEKFVNFDEFNRRLG
jgi:hypothetical protein